MNLYQGLQSSSPQKASSTLKFLPFNQSKQIIEKLNTESHPTLIKIEKKFNGLCELICNRILIDDLLGKENSIDSLKKSVTVERLNEDVIKNSHLLKTYSVFQKVMAFLFGIFPDNIFSCFDQWNLVKRSPTDQNIRLVNRDILEKGFNNIDVGKVLKFQVLSKSGFSFTGHSLLIKKVTNDKYIFFDPNIGEKRMLSFFQLCWNMDKELENNNATDLLLIKGETFLKRLGIGKNDFF